MITSDSKSLSKTDIL